MKNILILLFPFMVVFDCNQPEKINVTKNDSSSNKEINSSPDTSGLDISAKKFRQGIDFTATGNEPFWSLEIDFNKSMHFKTLSGFEITTPVPKKMKAMDANVTRYSAKTEQGTLTIQLAKKECINDMSGVKSDYSVTIDTKNNTDKNLIRYKGCGQYLSDYRLHDIWVLISINDNKLTPTDFMKGLPLLELNLTEKKVFGHTGCNNLNGPIEVLGKKIRFGNLATTRMACGNMQFENRYLSKLVNRTIPYNIQPGKLHLQVTADSVFTYKKID
ncbi:MAG TPA: META domain-containing protein [Chitinophagaceae bacterium]|nr:META domain-containing protein [Chitinophagaceae bacterium]